MKQTGSMSEDYYTFNERCNVVLLSRKVMIHQLNNKQTVNHANQIGNCVISGFHSVIERDVFHYLVKGTQPIIVALHRGIGPRLQLNLSTHIRNQRLLIVSPFEQEKRRGDRRSAAIRNQMMIDMADRIAIGYASSDGQLCKLIPNIAKPIVFI